MELPIPKSRSGWFAALLLLIFSYYYYYNNFYDGIFKKYSEHFFTPTVGETAVWKVEVQSPKYTSIAIPGWIYVRIINKSSYSEEIDFNVILNNEKVILLPSNYKDDVFKRSFSDIDIHGYSAAYFRVKFGNNVIVGDDCTENLNLYIDNVHIKFTDALPCPEENTQKALECSIIENLLLPPWANTVIPTLVFIFCYLAERKSFEEKKTNVGAMIFIGIFAFIEMLFTYRVLVYFLGMQENGESIWLNEVQTPSTIVILLLVWLILLFIPETIGNWLNKGRNTTGQTPTDGAHQTTTSTVTSAPSAILTSEGSGGNQTNLVTSEATPHLPVEPSNGDVESKKAQQ